MQLSEAVFQQITLGVLGALALVVVFLLVKLHRISQDLSRYRHNQSIDTAVRLIEGLSMDREIKRIVVQALEQLYRTDTPSAQLRQQKVDDVFNQAQRQLDPPSRPR